MLWAYLPAQILSYSSHSCFSQSKLLVTVGSLKHIIMAIRKPSFDRELTIRRLSKSEEKIFRGEVV